MSRRARALFEQLEQILFTEGFRGLSLDDLAARLRCSKRTLYEIGPNKPAMVKAVIAVWSERIEIAARAAACATDMRTRLDLYLRPAIVESRTFSPRFIEDVASDSDVSAALEAHQRARVDGLRQIIEDGRVSGEFAALNSALVAELSFGAIQRLNSPELLRRADLSFSEAFDAFYDLLLRGLATYEMPRASGFDNCNIE